MARRCWGDQATHSGRNNSHATPGDPSSELNDMRRFDTDIKRDGAHGQGNDSVFR